MKKIVFLTAFVLCLSILNAGALALEIIETNHGCKIDTNIRKEVCSVELEFKNIDIDMKGYKTDLKSKMVKKEAYSMKKYIPNSIEFTKFEWKKDKVKIEAYIKPTTQNYFGIAGVYNSTWFNSSLEYAQNVTFINIYGTLENPTLWLNFTDEIYDEAQSSGYDIFPYDLNGSLLPYKLLFYDNFYRNSLMLVTTNQTITNNTNITLTIYYGNSSYNTDQSTDDVFSTNSMITNFWFFDNEGSIIQDLGLDFDLTKTGDCWDLEINNGYFGFGNDVINCTSRVGLTYYNTQTGYLMDTNRTIGVLANTWIRDIDLQMLWSHGNNSNHWQIGESQQVWLATTIYSGSMAFTLHNGTIRDPHNTSYLYSIKTWYLHMVNFGNSGNNSNASFNGDIKQMTFQDYYLNTQINQTFFAYNAAGTEGNASPGSFRGAIQFIFISNGTIWSDNYHKFFYDSFQSNNYMWGIEIEQPIEFINVSSQQITSYFCNGNNSVQNITTVSNNTAVTDLIIIKCPNGCNENNLIMYLFGNEPNLCNPKRFYQDLILLVILVAGVMVLMAILKRRKT